MDCLFVCFLRARVCVTYVDQQSRYKCAETRNILCSDFIEDFCKDSFVCCARTMYFS